MKITLDGFAGALKTPHPKLLPSTIGVDARNMKPQRGDLRPWRVPLTVATVSIGTGINTIYRFGRDTASDAAYWFAWSGIVHAVRGYNAEDTTERTYYTGSGAPKWTDNTIALASTPYPTAYRDLGVPVPTVQPIATSNNTGTSANTETRYYTYTYVTDIGEESAPAPVSLQLVCKVDDTVAITNIGAPPSGNFTIDRIRIYVTVTGQSGDTEFFFLREISSALTSTTDDLRARGEVLATDGWLPPPSDLSFLTEMWNGMLAGISGKGVRVCEPFAPYAWKISNEFLPPDAVPVALAVWQQNLLILTTAKPAIVNGTSPDSLDLAPLEFSQACIAPMATVSFGHGVAWVCPDGLAYYGNGGAKLLTAGLFTRDDWQAMNPTGMVASIYEGAYLGFYTDGGGVRRGFMLDPLNPQAVFFLDAGFGVAFFDRLQDALYVYGQSGADVQKWDAGASNMTALFRSKEFVTPLVSFGWSRVVADAYPVTLKVDAGPFTSPQLTNLIATNPAVLSASGTNLRFTVSVQDARPFRLPSGFQARQWQVQIETTNPVQPPVSLATSAEELV